MRQGDQLVRNQAPDVLETASRADFVQLFVGAVEHAPAHGERLVAHSPEHLEEPAHLRVVGEPPAEVDALARVVRTTGPDAATPGLQRVVQVGDLVGGASGGPEQLLVELLRDARERVLHTAALLLALRGDAVRGQPRLLRGIAESADVRRARRAAPAAGALAARIDFARRVVRRSVLLLGVGDVVVRRCELGFVAARRVLARLRIVGRLGCLGQLATDGSLVGGLVGRLLLALQVPQVEQVAAGEHAVLAQRAQHGLADQHRAETGARLVEHRVQAEQLVGRTSGDSGEDATVEGGARRHPFCGELQNVHLEERAEEVLDQRREVGHELRAVLVEQTPAVRPAAQADDHRGVVGVALDHVRRERRAAAFALAARHQPASTMRCRSDSISRRAASARATSRPASRAARSMSPS